MSIMFGFQKIIEKRITEAQKRGKFDCLPPELQLKKEIRQMEDMLDNIPDEKEKYRQIKKINFKIMQLNMIRKKSPLLEETEIYYNKLIGKLAQE